MVNAVRRRGMVIGLAVVIGSIMIVSAGEPIIVISSPSDGETVYSDTITVSGGAMGTEGAVVESVTVNGVLASGTTSWSAVISLDAGSNTITVMATDNFGNKATKTRTVIYSTPSPTPYVPPSGGGDGGKPSPSPTSTPTRTPTPTPVPTGSISITTAPSGAEVYLDESLKGVTPISLDNVTGGSYTIKIVKEGYINETKAISLGAGEAINLDIPLKPLTGSINVSSIPSGARVHLDGDNKGETPLQLSEVVVGLHFVTLTKSGYDDVTKTVSVSVDETSYVKENLTGYGSLEVSTDPPGVRVYLDDDYKGETPLSISKAVEGLHSITLTKSGYDTVKKNVSVSVGETTYVKEPLTGYGSLSIISDPSGARVYLDGDYKGETPLSIGRVVEGSHSIKLTKFGYADVTNMIQVSAVKPTHVSETLPFTPWLNVIGVVCSIIVVIFGTGVGINIIKKKRAPKTLPVKQEVSIKRTIWDPTNNRPITTSKEDKEFPIIRETIKQLEKGDKVKHYWFVLCIANHANKGINAFSVMFEAKETLKILSVYVEGKEEIKEREIRDKIRHSEGSEFGFDRYSTKPLSESIPPKESRRVYFKLSSDGCGIDYEIINGRVELPDLDLISDKAPEIAQKSFHYSCEVPPEDENKEDLEEIEKWLEKTEKDKAARTDPDIRGLIIRRKGDFLSKLKENAENQNVVDALTYARLVNQHFKNEPLSDVGDEALQELKTEIIARLEDDFKKDTSMLGSTMKRILSICTTIDETWDVDMLEGKGKNE